MGEMVVGGGQLEKGGREGRKGKVKGSSSSFREVSSNSIDLLPLLFLSDIVLPQDRSLSS